MASQLRLAPRKSASTLRPSDSSASLRGAFDLAGRAQLGEELAHDVGRDAEVGFERAVDLRALAQSSAHGEVGARAFELGLRQPDLGPGDLTFDVKRAGVEHAFLRGAHPSRRVGARREAGGAGPLERERGAVEPDDLDALAIEHVERAAIGGERGDARAIEPFAEGRSRLPLGFLALEPDGDDRRFELEVETSGPVESDVRPLDLDRVDHVLAGAESARRHARDARVESPGAHLELAHGDGRSRRRQRRPLDRAADEALTERRGQQHEQDDDEEQRGQGHDADDPRGARDRSVHGHVEEARAKCAVLRIRSTRVRGTGRRCARADRGDALRVRLLLERGQDALFALCDEWFELGMRQHPELVGDHRITHRGADRERIEAALDHRHAHLAVLGSGHELGAGEASGSIAAGLVDVGADEAGAEHRDADAVRLEVEPQALAEADHRILGVA